MLLPTLLGIYQEQERVYVGICVYMYIYVQMYICMYICLSLYARTSPRVGKRAGRCPRVGMGLVFEMALPPLAGGVRVQEQWRRGRLCGYTSEAWTREVKGGGIFWEKYFFVGIFFYCLAKTISQNFSNLISRYIKLLFPNLIFYHFNFIYKKDLLLHQEIFIYQEKYIYHTFPNFRFYSCDQASLAPTSALL